MLVKGEFTFFQGKCDLGREKGVKQGEKGILQGKMPYKSGIRVLNKGKGILGDISDMK